MMRGGLERLLRVAVIVMVTGSGLARALPPVHPATRPRATAAGCFAARMTCPQ